MKGQTKVVEYIHRDEYELMYYNYVKKDSPSYKQNKKLFFSTQSHFGSWWKNIIDEIDGEDDTFWKFTCFTLSHFMYH